MKGAIGSFLTAAAAGVKITPGLFLATATAHSAQHYHEGRVTAEELTQSLIVFDRSTR